MSGKSPRPLKVADRIQVELSDILRLVKDPRLGFITVTAVDVTDDLRSARIYVSALDAKELTESMQALNSARGFIRGHLGKRLGLRHVPEIAFIEDHSAERGRRIEDLLRSLKEGEAPEEPE